MGFSWGKHSCLVSRDKQKHWQAEAPNAARIFEHRFFLEHFPAEMFDLGWTFREVLAIVS
jgi:hypothetical protein